MNNSLFEMLKDDHKKVKEILGSIEETKESTPALGPNWDHYWAS